MAYRQGRGGDFAAGCRPVVALALALAVGGCALAAGPAPDTYDISAPTKFDGAGSSGIQLAIAEPAVVGALDSDRVVVRPSSTQITYLSGAQWSDRVSKLVQARLIQAFQNSGRIRSAGPPGGAVVNDAGIVSDLNAFQVDAAQNAAVVDLSARLVKESDGRVIASKRFTATVPLTDSGSAAMIDALNAAFDQVASEIVAWTLARV